MTRHIFRRAARKERKVAEELEQEMAARHWHYCAKCARQTWHVWGGAYGWVCTWPQHHDPRWRKAGDALAFLERKEGE